jgi:ribosomal protein S18 acetylase RimI-like enzyme
LFRAADLPALERCVVEIQDAERVVDLRLRPGSEIASAYCEQLQARCAAQAGAIFVADIDGAVAGFVAVQACVPSEELDEPPGNHALVSDLVVLPEHRRHGIGRALLAMAEAHALTHHAREIRIGVLAANTPARRIYQAVGFTPYFEMLAKRLA